MNSKDVPDVKNAKIGEEKELTIKVKIKALRAPDNWEIAEKKMNPKDVIADLCITGFAHKSK